MFSRKGPEIEPTLTIYMLPNETLLEIFKRCDPVTIRRSSQVCRRWRDLIQSNIAQESCSFEDKDKIDTKREGTLIMAMLGRLYIADRKRIVLEKLRTREETAKEAKMMEKMRTRPKNETVSRTQQDPTSVTGKITSAAAMDGDSVYVDEQIADNSLPSWAFMWNIEPWLCQYDIKEVLLHNFCAFLEREIAAMAEPTPHVASNRERLAHSQNAAYLHTPPWSAGNSPSHVSGVSGTLPSSTANTIAEGFNSTAIPDPNIWNAETMDEILHLSSGRIERLAQILSSINPLNLVFKDPTRRARRPIRIVFFAIKLLRQHLRSLTLDNLTGSESVELAKWLSLSNMNRLVVKQPKTHAALVVNEQLLFKWLRLPEEKRNRITFEFHQCKELTAEGVAKFIKAWQVTPEVCEFDSISIDCETLHPVEFLAVVEKKPSERLSSTLCREFAQRATLSKREKVFSHEKSGATILFSTDQKTLTLQFISPPPKLSSSLSPRSAPSLKNLEYQRSGAKGSFASLISNDVGNFVNRLFYSPEQRSEQKKRMMQIA